MRIDQKSTGSGEQARDDHRKIKWDPTSWVGLMPNGIGEVKPNHYLDMLKVTWQNRDQIPFAWRILSRGVCDGCALGTTGLKDWTMKGPHLCTVRLNLLRLNTMPAMDFRLLEDVEGLRKVSSKALRDLGRLPYPMVRRKGERGFKRISWDEALDTIGQGIRGASPDRLAFYLTARGLTNEVYYVGQKVARFLGTNSVDNAARICHSPSTFALKDSLGIGASECSYIDWLGTDLLILIGSDVPNNQPVTTKYMYLAKKQGTRILVVNPYREPGLERYWVPSAMESAIFGTKLTDEFFTVHTGGDLSFFTGVLKALINAGQVDAEFVKDHTTGFDKLRASVQAQDWGPLEQDSGSSRSQMERFAKLVGEAKTAVFVWSMGITQHPHGVATIGSVLNLALSRGFVGRKYCGVMPIRGHSGVQGGAEMGAYATSFPGAVPITPQAADSLETLWGFRPPDRPGLTAVEILQSCHAGKIDVLYSVGGNFLETLPEPEYVRDCLARTPLRVHQDIVVTSQMLVDPMETVVLLPACTRYEQRGGGCETSTERRVIFSPEIPGRRIGEARSEWEILMGVAEHASPERAHLIHFETAEAVRAEIARANPAYDGIQFLSKQGDAFQWGGRHLCEGWRFPTADGKAHFSVPTPPTHLEPLTDGRFRVSTRRGKQFNSMVLAKRDPLTGATRDAVFMSQEDANRLGLKGGDRVLLTNDVGKMAARVKIAALRPGNLQIHWPEGNVLIRRGVQDPISMVPDYNAVVEVTPAEE